ncbi:MAG: hypothetical protein K2X03_22220 [Bryobacteraceae bacterium]|nr:hypothetical protein [Bryobacteraceae bacterium]
MLDSKREKRILEAGRLLGELMKLVGEDSPDLHKVLVNLCVGAQESVNAILLLSDNGYEREAWSVTRSIFEMAVNARYLRKHPDQLERYMNFSYVTDKKLSDWLATRGFPLPPPLSASVDANAKRVEELYAHKSRWHKSSMAEMAQSVGLKSLYDGFYPTMCNSVHGGYSFLEGENSSSGFPFFLGMVFYCVCLGALDKASKGGLEEEIDLLLKDDSHSALTTNIHIA